jgi:hypothetical protein
VVNTLVWLWWVIDLSWFKFKSGIFWLFYPYMFVWRITFACPVVCRRQVRHCRQWWGSSRSRRPIAEDRRWSSTYRVLGGWTFGRSGDVICDLYRAQWDEERGFPSWASKPRLVSFPIWASKPVAVVWWFGSQNYHDGFLVCASKPRVRWFVGCVTKSTGGGRHVIRIEI